MADPSDRGPIEPPPTERSDRARKWVRLGSIGLIVAAGLSFLTDLRPTRVPVPLAPLAVSRDLEPVSALPAEFGALRGYDLVLVTLDTTRPDRIGLYGNAEIATPTLDHLAANGVVFSNAVATASTTLPTHASILTGLYPQHHGARTNALHRLEEDRTTLAELLAEAGYDTAAFVSSFVLDRRFGLAQGFDLYDDRTDEQSGPAHFAERRGDHTTDRAVRWLARTRSRPYFLWVHYYDPHVLYQAPPPYSQENASPYDAEIAFVDRQLATLLAAVEAGGRGRTLVVVLADHGEALGERGEWTHGYLVQEATIRIPLILYAPDGLGRGYRVATRVSQVDMLPTIAALLGVEPPAGLDGVDLARSPDPGRTIFAEAVEGQANYGWAPLAAAYRGPYKYVDGPRPELFDLAQDPLEQRDLVTERSGEARALRRQLAAFSNSASEARAGSRVALSAGDIARLAALGYTVTAGGANPAGETGPDPHAMIPIMVRLLNLIALAEEDVQRSTWGRLFAHATGRAVLAERSDLIAALQELAAEHPDFAPTWRYLAFYYDAAGRTAEAKSARARFGALIGRTGGPSPTSTR